MEDRLRKAEVAVDSLHFLDHFLYDLVILFPSVAAGGSR